MIVTDRPAKPKRTAWLALTAILAFGALAATALVAAPAQAERKVLKIGAPIPVTGPLAPEGKNMRTGDDIWADAVNAAGGVKIGNDHYKVEIVYADYQSNTARAVQLTERLITEDKVDALLAPMGSGPTKAASNISEKYGVPMVASNAASEDVYNQGYKYLFGLYTPIETVTDPIVTLIHEKNPNVKRLAVLARNDLFPLALATAVTKAAKREGLEVVFDEKFPIGTLDFATTLTQMRAAKPDWIYVAGYINDVILIRKQIHEQGLNPQALTMLIGPTNPPFLNGVGDELSNNVTTSGYWDPAADYKGEGSIPSTAKYVEIFKKRFNGAIPDYGTASSAAAGVVLELAFEKAGTVDKAKVRDALANLDVNTFYGPVKFGPNGQITSLKPPILQIQDGKPTVVYPPEIQQAEIRFGIK